MTPASRVAELHGRVIALCEAGNQEGAILQARAILAEYPNYMPVIKTYKAIGNNNGNIGYMIEAAEYYRLAGHDPLPMIMDAFRVDQLYCDWKHRDFLLQHIFKRLKSTLPLKYRDLHLLAAIDDPEIHRLLGMCNMGDVLLKLPKLPWLSPKREVALGTGRKIRLGYVSNDLRRHPMPRVLAGIVENHNRDQFELYAYDYSHDDHSPERERMKKAFDVFRIMGTKNGRDCAAMITADAIDILVDLKGYSMDARPEIFAFRPAPIQVSFLGYPATLAAHWIDYVVADRHVIPPGERSFWSESMAYMPRTYYPAEQSKDLETPINLSDRSQHGLPLSGFVFGCFNNPFKTTPAIFDLWMRILKQAPGSTLWLYNKMPTSQNNLRQKAARHGVDPTRIIFAGHAEHSAHLTRYHCMDLFLDTTPYNAHTTSTDALSKGVPVLTLPGRSFASRVGLSLLKTLELDELIAANADDYVKKAVDLAHSPEKFTLLKTRLKEIRHKNRFFDISQYSREFDALLLKMVALHASGKKPQDITGFL